MDDSPVVAGIILIFKDQDALRAYSPHPAHLEYIEQVAPYVQGQLNAGSLPVIPNGVPESR